MRCEEIAMNCMNCGTGGAESRASGASGPSVPVKREQSPRLGVEKERLEESDPGWEVSNQAIWL